jgi:2-oxoglutarate dehydrogenase complex dehydrogenase (E1) component-like enzyme
MGAWDFIHTHLPPNTKYVGRVRSAVTATGSFKQHKQELDQFMNEAFE